MDQREPSGQPPDRSKRGFLKAGLIAGPVIVTLSAKPAWGQTAVMSYQAAGANGSLAPLSSLRVDERSFDA